MSPILANIDLHHVLDVWLTEDVKAHCKGQAILCRYADGTPVQAWNIWGGRPLTPIVHSGV